MIKRFSTQVIVRVTLILLSCLLLSFYVDKGFWFTVLGIGILIIIQLISLIRYVNSVNYALVKFLDALKTGDHSVYFSPTKKGNSFTQVYRDFNTIIKLFKKNKIEKEAQFNHFKQILEDINLGILSVRKQDITETKPSDEIFFLNKAVSEILSIPRHKYWHRISKSAPWFAQEVLKLQNGGKTLIESPTSIDKKRISLSVIEVDILNIPYLILTFQDIASEIEQKEIEAWHNIIRVLAHEMLNSFTPVSSLAGTIKSMTESSHGKLLTSTEFTSEKVEDINLAAGAIQRRSEGLLAFVADYRKLSNLPAPEFKNESIKEFVEVIVRLMTPTLQEHKIRLTIGPIPSNAVLRMDVKLLEQVFINLIGNSIFALEQTKEPCINIAFETTDKQTILHVQDNGRGIEPEILSQIFIPFFTTRKNGSGIGLSLSKDIMKQHNGQILVSTEPNQFTRFSLVFNNES